MNEQETNSGAHGGAERIEQRYIGQIQDNETIDDVEAACKWAGGDFALELKRGHLNIFRVMVGVRA